MAWHVGEKTFISVREYWIFSALFVATQPDLFDEKSGHYQLCQ